MFIALLWFCCGQNLYIESIICSQLVPPREVSLEELQESGSLERFDEREFAPAAFEAYSLAVAPDLFARLPESVRDKGWFNIRLAYDNRDPQTGLAELERHAGRPRPRSIGSRRTLPPRTSTTHLPTR